jgi:hypothetical protein
MAQPYQNQLFQFPANLVSKTASTYTAPTNAGPTRSAGPPSSQTTTVSAQSTSLDPTKNTCMSVLALTHEPPIDPAVLDPALQASAQATQTPQIAGTYTPQPVQKTPTQTETQIRETLQLLEAKTKAKATRQPRKKKLAAPKRKAQAYVQASDGESERMREVDRQYQEAVDSIEGRGRKKRVASLDTRQNIALFKILCSMKDSWGKDTQKKIYSLAQTKLNESIGVDYTNIKAHMVDVVKKRRMERELSGTGEELDEVESEYNTALDAWIEVLDAATESKRLDKEELLRIEREGIRSQKDMKRMLLPQSAKKRLAGTDTSESDENDTSSGSDLDNENDEDSTKEASTTKLMLDGADESSSAYERSASSTISRGETPAASMKSRKRKHAPLSQVKTTEEKLLSAVDEILYDIATQIAGNCGYSRSPVGQNARWS